MIYHNINGHKQMSLKDYFLKQKNYIVITDVVHYLLKMPSLDTK